MRCFLDVHYGLYVVALYFAEDQMTSTEAEGDERAIPKRLTRASECCAWPQYQPKDTYRVIFNHTLRSTSKSRIPFLPPSYFSTSAALLVTADIRSHIGNRKMSARPTYAPIRPQDGDGDVSNANRFPDDGFVSSFSLLRWVSGIFQRTVF